MLLMVCLHLDIGIIYSISFFFFLIRILIFITQFLQRTSRLIQLVMKICRKEHTCKHRELQVLACWVLCLSSLSHVTDYDYYFFYLSWLFNSPKLSLSFGLLASIYKQALLRGARGIKDNSFLVSWPMTWI